ncbi:MAG: hypothetical protein AB7J30_04140 [Hyphomicrobium sp.]|uniref:hypothetical protein n=1 Tax=Hyphomicrobium sp. TaxID=82 RepID=UPI003D1205C2
MGGGCGQSTGCWFALARVLAVLAALGLPGCSNHIFRTFDIDNNDSLSIDAHQRAIVVTHTGGKTRDRTVVCAEPSPDAMTARAAAMSGSASGEGTVPGGGGPVKAAGNFSYESSEAAASIGLRTQTVQLLRDGLYRACEAYMNGAIDQHQYHLILANLDKSMVTLLGVDAIAGTVRAPATVVTTGPDGKPTTSEEAWTYGPADGVQAEAITNVLLNASSQSAMASMCLSLLASGELRVDNPGQNAVLERCDRLLDGTVNNLVAHPSRPMPPYRMTLPPPMSPRASAPAPAAEPSPHASLDEGWAPAVVAEDAFEVSAWPPATIVQDEDVRQEEAWDTNVDYASSEP